MPALPPFAVEQPDARPIVSAHEPDPTAGQGPVRLTIYDLLRSFVRSSRWASREEEYAAECLVNDLEERGAFGTLGDTVRSMEV